MNGNIDPNEVLANIATKTASNVFAKVWVRIKRIYLKVGPVNYNILFSLSHDPGTNTEIYYKEIMKYIQNFLSISGLSKEIIINDQSGNINFTNKEEVEKLRQRKNIDLIVWGEFTNSALKNQGKNLSELRLNFTYGHPDDPQKKIRSIVHLDLSSRLAVKNYWRIVDENSFNDVKIVSNNTLYMSIYIIALTLKLFGHIEKSASLFKRIYDQLTIQNDPFREHIKPHLANCYSLLIYDCVWQDRKQLKGIEYCRLYLEVIPNNYFALSNLALLEYKTGQIEDAKNIVGKLNKLYPDKPVTLLDDAFFYILQRKYRKAYECYRKVLKNKNAYTQFDPELLLEFLGEEYNKTAEPALLYASGIVAYYFSGNIDLAVNDLKTFLDKSDPLTYKYMVNHANKILAR